MKRSIALAAALPIMVGLLMPAPAQAATTTVSAALSASTVTLGATAVMRGAVSGAAGRPVRLEVLIASGWRPLRSTTTTSTGAYALTAPYTWLGGHSLRVVAPATATDTTGVSTSRAFTVRPSWSPAGAGSDWRWLSSSRPRFNPCQAISWRFNQNGGYASSLADLKGAFARLSQATGLTFTYAGTTTVTPRPGAYDTRAAITVGFTGPSLVRSLLGSVAGQGGGSWSTHDGRTEMVRATLVLDRTERLPAGFTGSGGATWGQVMEHEIGHTLGLGHALGAGQLMYGVASGRNHRFGAGDLSALRNIGLQAGCIPNSVRTV